MTTASSYSLRLVQPSEDLLTANKLAQFLTDISSDLAVSRGGHVPDEIVRGIIQERYTTVDSVLTFSSAAYRFILFDGGGDIAATILVAKHPGIVLAKDSKNLISPSDSSALSPYHCLFNLAVRRDLRRRGLARELLDRIESEFRTLLSGIGLWIRGEPPDHDIFIALNFSHRTECDGFFDDQLPVTPGFASLQDFNAKYDCGCPKASEQLGYLLTKKYKYGVFVRAFRQREGHE